MKVIVTSDWHIHNYKNYSEDDSRMKNIFSSILDMFNYAHQNNIETILFGGDMVERQVTTPIKVILETLQFFKDTFEKFPNIQVIAISGNHDLGEKSIFHTAESLVSWCHIMGNTFEQWHCIDLKSMQVDNLHIFGIPYLEYKEDYDKSLTLVTAQKELSNARYSILLIHQTPHLPGLNIPMDTDPNDERYGVFDQVFCGHIHKRMHLATNFNLIGTPLQHSFDEGGYQVDNGFIEYNVETKEKKYINLNYPKFIEIKEGQTEPSNCYVRTLPTFKGTSGIDSIQREVFSSNTNRQTVVSSYFEVEGNGDKDTLDIGLKILSKLTK